MTIGINASFLRKPGTGIGQVTLYFLQKLIENPENKAYKFILYCEEKPKLDFPLPENFHIRVFLPSWQRDDILRKILWERRLAFRAKKDECDAFLSLYQSSTVFRTPSRITAHHTPSIKHIMIVHDIIPRIFPDYQGNARQKIYWKRVEQGIRKADHIVAISEHTKNDLVREFSLLAKHIFVVSPDINPQFSQPVSSERKKNVLEKYHLSEGYIYHGGGLEIRKNTETLLRAYAKMIQTPSASIETKIPILVITGNIFDTKNKLATDVHGLIQELRLEEHVRLLGFVPDEDLPALYANALFFVYPSLYEGFGLPVLEAMALGVPVLSSDAASLPEVGGSAVLYVHPQDIEGMKSQMERLLSDRILRETLVSQGVLQRERFSWTQFVQSILSVIKNNV